MDEVILIFALLILGISVISSISYFIFSLVRAILLYFHVITKHGDEIVMRDPETSF